MNIDINQYDLSEIFRFDILKNILVNLSNGQKKLRDELEQIKQSNKKINEKITNLENINNSKSFDFKDELNKIDNINTYININSSEISYKNDNDRENNDNLNQESKINIPNNIQEQNKNVNFNNENLKENLENINIIFDKPKKSKINKVTNNFIDNKSNISRDIYLSFKKELYSIQEKINNLENELINQIKNSIKKSEEDSKNKINNNYEYLNKQINDLLNNREEQNKKIEDCLLKCNSIDIYNLLKDSGDGTINATKLMVNSLEEKVFTKFGFIEERHKKDIENIMKLTESKQNIDAKLEKIKKNVTDIKYNEITQIKESTKKNINDFSTKFNDITELLNNKEMRLIQKIGELENNISGIFDEKDEIIRKNNTNINGMQSSLDNFQNILNNFIKSHNNINQELISEIEKKLNNLKNKVYNLENNFNTISDSLNINKINEDIDKIKSVLEIKITKEHLTELYNMQMTSSEDINNLGKTISSLQEQMKKTDSNFTNIIPKIDSLMSYFISKKNKKKDNKITELDLKKFVEKEKFDEGLNIFAKKIENIFIEIESINRNLDDLKKEQNSYEKKEIIIKIEEQIHDQIEENKAKIIKNRNELNKQIKGIEIEIKSIWEELKRRESADSWILAKHPMNCFNCATCDNSIKIENPKEEYIPWNKIMPNKNYRIGKGFSHILERMSFDLINNIDDNFDGKETFNASSERNFKNESSINSIVQVEENKMNKVDKNINTNNIENNSHLERSNSQPKLATIRGRNLKSNKEERMRLPKVLDMAKRKAIFESFNKLNSFSDRDKNIINEYNLKNQLKLESPRIIKIKKKDSTHNISFILPSKKK